jgi:hypothetical protein
MRTMQTQPKPEPIRLSITFSEEAHAWLEKEATRRAISIGEIVRRIVDEIRGDYATPDRRGG